MMKNTRIMNSITIIILHGFTVFTATIATNQVMAQASMDVGNIISIIIPESDDANINIDQLTADFRRQLERIRQQNRVNKLERGLVSLKKVLPEMLQEEKKKMTPSFRRALSNLRNSKRIRTILLKDINDRISEKINDVQNLRHNIPSQFNLSKYYEHHDTDATTKRTVWPIKHEEKYNKKKLKFNFNDLSHLNIFDKIYNESNNDNSNNIINWNKLMRGINRREYSANSDCDDKGKKICGKKFRNGMSERDNYDTKPLPLENQFSSQLNYDQQREKLSMRNNNLNMMKRNNTSNDCFSIVVIDLDGESYSICNNTSLINIPKIPRDDGDYSVIKNNEYSGLNHSIKNKIILPINIEVDDFKEVEKIIANPQATLENINTSGFNSDNYKLSINGNTMKRRNIHYPNDNFDNAAILTSINQESNENSKSDNNKNSKNIFEFNERTRDFINDHSNNNGNNKQMELSTDGIGYKHHVEKNIPSIMHELNVDNKNFEIRIQRSINDNFEMEKSIDAQLHDLLMKNNKM